LGQIRVLPDRLANQIAAGEVVERPVSALKELLENSLDAGASKIKIDVEAGGKRRIRVEDNGCGMDRDDCLMALERHATSKLTRAEDLFSIKTLGFRGEALPSIASVSRFSLESVPDGENAGVRIQVDGNRLSKVTEISGNPGTIVTVNNLFYNIPARKKFLRRTETELSWIVNLVTQYSFVHIDKHFQLRHNGRTLIDVAPVSELKQRVYQHYGRGMLDRLLEVEHQAEWLGLRGMVSEPAYTKTSRAYQFLFVNRRLVKDRVLSHAITEAYHGFGEGRIFPVVFLFLELPSTEVDVNVHPAKTEVKFIQSNFVHDAVRDAIRERLVKQPMTVPYRVRDRPDSRMPWPQREQQAPLSTEPPPGPLFHNQPSPNQTSAYESFIQREGQVPYAEQTEETQAPQHDLFQPRAVPHVIGQFRSSYILAEDAEHLYLIDQHVAHERLLYDRIVAGLENDNLERQALLVPITIELSPHQAVELESLLPQIRKFGFDLDPFDGHTYVIREMPAFLSQENLSDVVVELIEKAQGQRHETALESMIDYLAATRACKAAVKINMSLTEEKMQHFIDRLWASSSPMFCPHGRPIVLTFSNEEIEKNFLRR